MSPVLSNAESKAFYDRFGARQDRQSFYEDRALDDLVAHADLATAKHVFEFGCGTGRLAARLFEECLGPRASPSERRIGPAGGARRGLRPFRQRLCPRSSERRRHHPSDRRSPPRAWHGGTLCLANLTWGDTLFSKAVSWVWQQFYAVRPAWVGGCRPIHLADFLPKDSWELLHHRRLRSYGITSEVAIARPRQAPNL